MRGLLAAWRRLAGSLRKERHEAELAEELRAHVEMDAEAGVRAGLSPEEARRRALLRLGGVEQVKEEVRERRGLPWLESVAADVKLGTRMLAKHPAATAMAVVTLAIGIAANATIFAMVSRFVLQPAPVGHPATLLSVEPMEQGECCSRFSEPLLNDLQGETATFSGVAGYVDLFPASVRGTGEAERAWGSAAATNFFSVAEIGMVRGRGFLESEAHQPVVVLGYQLWQRRFGGDPEITGKTAMLSGQPYTVVGVAPAGFHGLSMPLNQEFWVPLGMIDALMPNSTTPPTRDHHWLAVIARLKPGVTREDAAASLRVLGERNSQAHSDTEKGLGFHLDPAGSIPTRFHNTVLAFLGALLVVVLLVMGIACANVANLQMAQAASRHKEMATRLALGATRGRLMRQWITECLMVALAGGLLGLVVSQWATGMLGTFHLPGPVPLNLSVGVDWRVAGYAFGLSVAAGLVLGLLPAWLVTRPRLANALKGEDILGGAGKRWTLRNALIVAQVAMSLVLLCATGLFLRSLQRASRIDVGFRSHGLLMMSVDPRVNGYTPERTMEFFASACERVKGLPGVASCAWTDMAPLSGGHRSDGFEVEGATRATGPLPETVDLFMATPGYFATMDMPLLAGRDFEERDAREAGVAVVNQTFAKGFFGSDSPVGRRVKSGGTTFEIIGVVPNVKSRTLGEPDRAVLYRTPGQMVEKDPSFFGYALLVKPAGEVAGLAESVRGAIHAIDPGLAIYNEKTMEAHLREAMFLPRLAGTLFGVFGAAGFFLAVVGLYGVMSFSVSRRTREIGIRMVLGAQGGEVARLVVSQGMALACAATAAGLAAAWALAKFLGSFLYGIQPHDPLTFAMVPGILLLVALAACWIPARRAARVNPIEAIRYE